MLPYLKNILPRIQQFSKTLDHQENFVELPWVLIDEDGNRHVYIFQRDKSLIMSLSGKAQIGKWEYIPAAKSLLIDRGPDKVLLNHGFIANGIMILKLDGRENFPWVLINEKEVPDLDVTRYLKEIAVREMKLKTVTHDGIMYYYSDPDDFGINSSTVFYDENLSVVRPTLRLVKGDIVYAIQNGEVVDSYYRKQYYTDKGWVETRTINYVLTLGDQVFFNDAIATDDIYFFIDHHHYTSMRIADGRIAQLNPKKAEPWLTPISILAVIITFVVLVLVLRNITESETPSNSEPESLNPSTNFMDTAVSAPVPTEVFYTDEDCKQTIIRFLDAINTRQYDSLQNFFPTLVPKYYNDRNLSSEEVVKNIKQYDETLMESITVLDSANMTVSRNGSMYLVNTKQVQLITKRSDGVPMFYLSDVTYELTPSLEISKVSGKIESKDYNYRKLFGISESDKRPITEMLSAPTTEDFNRIFLRFSASDETEQFKEALATAVLDHFGKETPVYTEGSSNWVTLEMLVETLRKGLNKYVTAKSVLFNSRNKVNGLMVSY